MFEFMKGRNVYNAYVRFNCGLCSFLCIPIELIDSCTFYEMVVTKPRAEPFERCVPVRYCGQTKNGYMRYIEEVA